MSILYILAGANHFRTPGFYLAMMPPWIPKHSLMVTLSGVAEIILGLGLLFEPTRSLAGVGIITILIVFLTVHMYMLQNRNTLFKKVPTIVLLARIPVQFVLMYWASLYI